MPMNLAGTGFDGRKTGVICNISGMRRWIMHRLEKSCQRLRAMIFTI